MPRAALKPGLMVSLNLMTGLGLMVSLSPMMDPVLSARGVGSTYWSVGDVAGERRLVSDVAKIARGLGRVDVVEVGLCHDLTLTPFGR